MHWITVSWYHLLYFFASKRGLILMTAGLLLHLFWMYSTIVILPTVSAPLSPSEINQIRDATGRSTAMLGILWIVVLAYESAYLFNKGLFQRFLLNGFNRWQWGHSLLVQMFVLALLTGLLQALLINAIGHFFYEIQLISWSYTFNLSMSLLFNGLFTLLLVSLFPSYLAPLFVMAWQLIEGILNKAPFKEAFVGIPSYLPFEILNQWLNNPQILANTGFLLFAYFLLFTILFYALITRKSYA